MRIFEMIFIINDSNYPSLSSVQKHPVALPKQTCNVYNIALLIFEDIKRETTSYLYRSN